MKMTFFHPGTKVPPAPAIPQARIERTPLNPAKSRVQETFRRVGDPFSGTRLETWYAESLDGLWSYQRLEITGTPWITFHEPSNLEVGYHGSLDAAREATASGAASVELERLLAERRAS